METTNRILASVLVAMLPAACTSPESKADSAPATSVRWVPPAEATPHGEAPHAQARLLKAEPTGLRFYALVLQDGDEVVTALSDFAHEEHVVSAHFVAIGAVRDPEVAWFDPAHKQYKGITRHEQMEVLTLSGDIALAENGEPVVHAHMVLGASDGMAWGGHVLGAIASPTLEIYVTCFPDPLHKKLDAQTGLQLIDPTIGEPH
jgi:hypothetical protein